MQVAWPGAAHRRAIHPGQRLHALFHGIQVEQQEIAADRREHGLAKFGFAHAPEFALEAHVLERQGRRRQQAVDSSQQRDAGQQRGQQHQHRVQQAVALHGRVAFSAHIMKPHSLRSSPMGSRRGPRARDGAFAAFVLS